MRTSSCWNDLRIQGKQGALEGERGFATHNTGIHAWQHGQRVTGVGTTGWKCESGCVAARLSYNHHYCILLCLSWMLIFQRTAVGVGGGRIKKTSAFISKGGKDDHNDSLQVYTTQGVRHKFTCGKQAIHRCNPTKNLCDQTINLCKVAASILISSHHW